MDPKKLKCDFPILNRKDAIIYLDNGATTHKPIQVIQAVSTFYEKYNSNVHRGLSELGENATTLYEGARKKIAEFINAESEEIIFTKGTTEGINFVASAWGFDNVAVGDQIIITNVEHHSNILPWQRLAKRSGAELKFIRLNPETFFLKIDVPDLINEKTKIVAITHRSNVLSDVWESSDQLKKLIKSAHNVGAKVLIDAAQSVPHEKIDVKDLDVDFLTFSGHKMLGPTGVGVLYIKKELHEKLEPYQLGGSMVYLVMEEKFEWKEAPFKYEAGTPPIAQAIGLDCAVEYINNNVDYKQLKDHESSLCQNLIENLQKIDDVNIYGNLERLKKNGHLVSLSVDGIHAHDLCSYLSSKKIVVRAGHHCAQPLAYALGIKSSLRVSFYLYNTHQDVENFLKEFRGAVNFFK
ncbi:SufS family cysteine desulfurase [Candidatus Babeliales bacterium]|nr:SufS family cysteine desulfurase [Candidatus Babeliales bacterium]